MKYVFNCFFNSQSEFIFITEISFSGKKNYNYYYYKNTKWKK